jgi:hypothetical protein
METRYFNGETELAFWGGMKNEEFATRFPGVRGKRIDSFSRMVGKNEAGNLLPVERVINFKSNPSLHKCDGRCLHAKRGNCECSCGGANHGRGS